MLISHKTNYFNLLYIVRYYFVWDKSKRFKYLYYMGSVRTKPVFRVSDSDIQISLLRYRDKLEH